MPRVRIDGEEVDCESGAVLRDVLLGCGCSPHRGRGRTLNCGGHATCGTCAVRVEGDVDDPGRRERMRLRMSSHGGEDVRLACQTQVLGDTVVREVLAEDSAPAEDSEVAAEPASD